MNSTDIETLNRRHSILHQLHITQNADGFVLVEIDTPQARATICLQGAQVLTYKPCGHAPVLWLSQAARYVVGKSVRGGIPVCWPWFGPHASDAQKPAHGYARSAMWRVVETNALNDGAVRIVLELESLPAHHELWPHEARLQLHVSVGPTLTVEMVTYNPSSHAVKITEALHTYFHVSDIEAMSITGMEGGEFVNKVGGGSGLVQQGTIHIHGETDRVYLNTDRECVIDDPGLHRRIRIGKKGSHSTVVWNPWTEKAAKLSDMGENGFRQMVCVEAANALDNTISIPAGMEHRLIQVIAVEHV